MACPLPKRRKETSSLILRPPIRISKEHPWASVQRWAQSKSSLEIKHYQPVFPAIFAPLSTLAVMSALFIESKKLYLTLGKLKARQRSLDITVSYRRKKCVSLGKLDFFSLRPDVYDMK